MNGQHLPDYPTAWPAQQAQQMLQQPPEDTDRWAANMLLVVQAVERLHAAFDSKFIRSKSLP